MHKHTLISCTHVILGHTIIVFHAIHSCYSMPCTHAILCHVIMLFHAMHHDILCYMLMLYSHHTIYYSQLHIQTYVMPTRILHAKYSCNMPLSSYNVPCYSVHAMQHIQIHKIIYVIYIYLYNNNCTSMPTKWTQVTKTWDS